MDAFGNVEAQVSALRASGDLATAFNRWKRQSDGLAGFDQAESLIRFLRDPKAVPRSRKDAALAALCLQAQGGDQRGAAFLLWLVLPGLLRVRRSLASRRILSPQDLDAELVAGAWEAATKIHVDTHDVAARLVNAARWRSLAAIRDALEAVKRCQPMGADLSELGEVEDDSEESENFLAEALREGVVSQEEVQLLLASRRTIGEVRKSLGLTVYAAQNRKRRARQRLIDWLAVNGFLHTSGSAPRPKLSPSFPTSPDKV